MESIDYKKKYLKYKLKFFNLQKQIAGTLTTNPITTNSTNSTHKASVSTKKIYEIIRDFNPDYSKLIKYLTRFNYTIYRLNNSGVFTKLAGLFSGEKTDEQLIDSSQINQIRMIDSKSEEESFKCKDFDSGILGPNMEVLRFEIKYKDNTTYNICFVFDHSEINYRLNQMLTNFNIITPKDCIVGQKYLILDMTDPGLPITEKQCTTNTCQIDYSTTPDEGFYSIRQGGYKRVLFDEWTKAKVELGCSSFYQFLVLTPKK
jgi:hypothetical protein